MPNGTRWRRILVAVAVVPLLSGCLHFFVSPNVQSVATTGTRTPTQIAGPVKAHLRDGSTMLFRQGATIDSVAINGAGEHYPLLSRVATPVNRVLLDSVVGIEAFETQLNLGASLVVSAAATAGAYFALVAAAIAIFGSCPTVYADTGTGPVLEAEGFSYAIAPLFEHRDVDALRARSDENGIVRLELRNEALETHFINHVELLRVAHGVGERVVPDQRGRPIALSALRPARQATDRAGRDVTRPLASSDGMLFSSDPSVIRDAKEGDLDDWIDIVTEELPRSDSLVVLLRLRNSLLNTVLLYEGILGGRDATDWLSYELQRISTAVDVSRWYTRTMGMRVSVHGEDDAPNVERHTSRVGDVGPIAFRDVAVVLPRSSDGAARERIRLRFVADNWRIDQVQVTVAAARPGWTALPVVDVVVPKPAQGETPFTDTAAVGALADADDRYLETRPGQRMTLVFAPSAPPTTRDSAATFLIAWQGWYQEWIRGAWLAAPTRTAPFVPGDAAVLTALRRWHERRGALEREFYKTRIPVQ